MDMTNKKRTDIAIICVFVFFAALVALDISSFYIIPWYVKRRMIENLAYLFYVTIFLSSICGYICLYKMFKLIRNIQNEILFSKDNISYMKSISNTCFVVFVITALSAVYYLPFAFAAAAALFLMVIVEIVGSAFKKACEMKEELDLTI